MAVFDKLIDLKNTVEGRLLAIFMAIILVLSMTNIYAFADSESRALDKSEVPGVLFDVGKGAVINVGTADDPQYPVGNQDSKPYVALNSGNDLTFIIELEEGYETVPDGVTATVGDVELTSANFERTAPSTYTLTNIASMITVKVKTRAVEVAAQPEVAATSLTEETILEPETGESEVVDREAAAITNTSVVTQSGDTQKVIYWNPSRVPITDPADDTTQIGKPGSDSNSGISEEFPVLTWEGVMKQIGNNQDWTVVVMTTAQAGLEEAIDGEKPTKTMPNDLVIDGGVAQPTLITWNRSPEELFTVPIDEVGDERYSLTLKNVTLNSGTIDNAIRIIGADYVNGKTRHGALLTIDENVRILGDIQTELSEWGYSVDGATKNTKPTIYDPIKVVATPPTGVTYRVYYSGINDNLNYLYTDVIDASVTGIDAKQYFTLSPRNTNAGWQLLHSQEGLQGQGVTEVIVSKLELYRDYEYTAIYLNGQAGSDANFGGNCAYPVKTFAKAKELLADKLNGSGIIYICDTVDVSGTEEWSLPAADFPGSKVVACADPEGTHGGGTPKVTSKMVNVKPEGDLTLSDITLEYPIADQRDSVMVGVEAGATLTTSATVLTGGATLTSGYAIRVAGSSAQTTVTLNDTAITKRTYGVMIKGASGDARATTSVELNGGSITDIVQDVNSYVYGDYAAAISSTNASVTINGTTISGSRAYGTYGSGLYLNNSTFTMTAGSFDDNRFSTTSYYSYSNETLYGGAIYATGSSLDISGGSFTSNSTRNNYNYAASSGYDYYGYGGAIYATNGGSINISGSTAFTSNHAYYAGGALYVSGSIPVTISGATTFTANNQSYSTSSYSYGGGAIFHASSQPLTIEGATFTLNSSYSPGGAICMTAGGATISSSSFTTNSAYYNGGAIYTTAALTVNSGSFVDNLNTSSNGGWGGAIYSNGSYATTKIGSDDPANPVLFSGNKSYYGGSAIVGQGNTLTLEKYVTITGGVVTSSYGGAVYTTGTATIKDKVAIEGNTSPYGGGLYVASGTATIKGDASISGNRATSRGGGIYTNGGTTYIEGNAVIDSNTTAGAGGGIYASANVVIKDSVTVSNNVATQGGGLSAQARTNIDGVDVVFHNNRATSSTNQTAEGETRAYSVGSQIYNTSCLELTGGTFTTDSTDDKDLYGGIYLDITGTSSSYYPYFDATRIDLGDHEIYLHTTLSRLWALKDPGTTAGMMPISVNTNVYDIGSVVVMPIASTYTILNGRSYTTSAFGEAGADVSKRSSTFEGGQLPEKTTLGGFEKNVIIVGEGVYLDGANGDDNNLGTSPADAVKTWDRARELLVQYVGEAKAREEGSVAASKLVFEPYIYICGEVRIKDEQTWHLYDANNSDDYEKLYQSRGDRPAPEVRRFASYYGVMTSINDAGGKLTIEHTNMNGMAAALATNNTVGATIYASTGEVTLLQGANINSAYQYAISLSGNNASLLMKDNSVVQANRDHGVVASGGATITMEDKAKASAETVVGTVVSGRAAVYVSGSGSRLTMLDESRAMGGVHYAIAAYSSGAVIDMKDKSSAQSSSSYTVNVSGGAGTKINMQDEASVIAGGSYAINLNGAGTELTMIDKTLAKANSIAVHVGTGTKARVGEGSTADRAPVLTASSSQTVYLTGSDYRSQSSNRSNTVFEAMGYTSILRTGSGGTNIQLYCDAECYLSENVLVTQTYSSSPYGTGVHVYGANGASYHGPVFQASDNVELSNFSYGFYQYYDKNLTIDFRDQAKIKNCTYGIYTYSWNDGDSPENMKVTFADSSAIEDFYNFGIYFSMPYRSSYGGHTVIFKDQAKMTGRGMTSSYGYYDYGSGSRFTLQDSAEITNAWRGVHVQSYGSSDNRRMRAGGSFEMRNSAKVYNNIESGIYASDSLSYPLGYSIKLSDAASITDNRGYGIYGGFGTTVELGSGTSVVNNATSLSETTQGRSIYARNNMTVDANATIDDEVYLSGGSPYLITLTNTTGLNAKDQELAGKFKLGYAANYIGERVVGPDGDQGSEATTVANAAEYFDLFATKNIPSQHGEPKGIVQASPYIVVGGSADVYIAGAGTGVGWGNDANNGASADTPIATFERAKEILKNKPSGARVIICNQPLYLYNSTTWSFDEVYNGETGYISNAEGEYWKPVITRNPGYSNYLFYFAGTNTYRFNNVIFDSAAAGNTNQQSDYQFYNGSSSYTPTVEMNNVTMKNFNTRYMFYLYQGTAKFTDLTVEDSTFHASSNSLGSFWHSPNYGNATFERATFTGNTLNTYGSYSSLMYVGGGTKLDIKNSVFDKNTINASGSYSALFTTTGSATTTIEQTDFSNNTIQTTGSYAGGFVYNTSATSTMRMNGVNIADNTQNFLYNGTRYGGLVNAMAGTLDLNDTKITGNAIKTASQSETGPLVHLYPYYGNVEFTMAGDSSIVNNTITQTNSRSVSYVYGGAIGVRPTSNAANINLSGGVIGSNTFDHVNPAYNDRLLVFGAGMYTIGSGQAMLQGTSFIDNVAPRYYAQSPESQGGALYLSGSTKTMINGGQFTGNQASKGSAVYLTGSAELVFAGGTFGGNISNGFAPADKVNRYEYSAIFVDSPNCYLRGGRAIIDDHIYLNNSNYPLTLYGSIYQKNRLYNIDVKTTGSNNFKKGSVVVKPDGDVITNATQYHRYFDVASPGFVLAKQTPNLVLKSYVFLDSTNTDTLGRDGTNPDTAFVSLAEAKDFLKGSVDHTLFYVSGPLIISDDQEWSMAETYVGDSLTSQIIRYTGFSLTGTYYDAYLGDLFTVEEGVTFNLNDIEILGRRDIDNIVGGSLVHVKPGAILNLNDGTTLGTNTSAAIVDTEAVNASQGRGGAVYNQGTLNIASNKVNITATNASRGGAVYMDTGSVFNVSKSPYIEGSVYLTGKATNSGEDTSANTYIAADKYYMPQKDAFGQFLKLSVDIENPYNGREVVDYSGAYTPESTDKTFYKLASSIEVLYSLNNRLDEQNVLELQQKNVIYVDGVNGSDENDGGAPKRAVKTLRGAYDKMLLRERQSLQDGEKVTGGVVYVVDTVTIGAGENIKAFNAINSAQSTYSDNSGAGAIDLGGTVSIRRYVKPAAFTELASWSDWDKETLLNPLFKVDTDGNFGLQGMNIDGHSQDVSGDERFAAYGTNANAALIQVAGGTFSDNSGQYSNNANVANNGHGGAIDIESGTAALQYTVIRGTSAEKGGAVYQGDQLKISSGNSYITGEIYLAGSGSESDTTSSKFVEFTVFGIQNNGTTGVFDLRIEDPYRGRQVVEFPDGGDVSASQRAKFTLDDETRVYFSLANRQNAKNILELQYRSAVYIDGQAGNDSNNGESADTAVATLAKAYEVAELNDASILYVVDTVLIDGSMAISPTYYVPGDYDGTVEASEVEGAKLLTRNSLEIRRYAQPDAHDSLSGFTHESNRNALFLIESGNFIINGLTIDGHSAGLSGQTIAETMSVAEGVQTLAPLIVVNGFSPTVWLNEGTNLINNNNVTASDDVVSQGGAIANYGTVNFDGATLAGNSSAKGAGIYQHGTFNIEGMTAQSMSGQEIYLGADMGSSDTNYKINVNALLPNEAVDDDALMVNVDNAVRLRDIAQFTAAALDGGEGTVDDEMNHFRLGTTVPDSLQLEVSPTEFNTLELQGDATIKYEVRTQDRVGVDVSDDFTGGTTSISEESMYALNQSATPNSEAQANTHYVFKGWYYDEACTKAVAGEPWITSDGMVINPQMFTGSYAKYYDDVTYYALFQEEVDAKANMIPIEYKTATVDRDGKDRTADGFVGGSINVDLNHVSVITGKTSAGEAPTSTAAANPYYTFLGWYEADALQGGTLNTDKRIQEGAKFEPSMKPWTATTYVAVFQEETTDPANMVEIEYAIATIDRDGFDRTADGYVGGVVEPSVDRVSVITGKTSSGNAPASEAKANQYYTFVGWYSGDAFEAGSLASNKVVTDQAKITPAIDPWQNTTYIAVFQEETTDPANMVKIDYVAKTTDLNGRDVSTVGGSTSPTTTTVSIISGTLTSSVATANDHFVFVGWFKNYETSQAPAYANQVTADVTCTPVRPAAGWADDAYYAVFQEDTSDENLVTLGYAARTVDRDGIDRTAEGYQGGSVTNDLDKVTAVLGQTLEGNDPTSTAQTNEYYRFLGWYSADAFNGGTLDESKRIQEEVTLNPSMDPWVNVNYLAVFQEEYTEGNEDNMVSLVYDVRTVDRTGADRSQEYVGGTVDPGQERISIITGKTTTGASPLSTATANKYYTLLGWYAGYDVTQAPAYSERVSTSDALEASRPATGWTAMTYYAVFQEELTNVDNMVTLVFEAKTVDAENRDRSAYHMGGSTTPTETKVSVITGLTAAGETPGSKAPAQDGFNFVGWYATYDAAQVQPYNSWITEADAFEPTRPSNGWEDDTFYAVFQGVIGDDPVVTPPIDEGTTPGPLVPIIQVLASGGDLIAGLLGDNVGNGEGGQDETALDDEGTPLAGGQGYCWVHYYLVMGILITAIYSVAVLVRRRTEMGDYVKMERAALTGEKARENAGQQELDKSEAEGRVVQ